MNYTGPDAAEFNRGFDFYPRELPADAPPAFRRGWYTAEKRELDNVPDGDDD